MSYNEDSRVKIPCILHLARLGYEYLSLKSVTWDKDTNIFPKQFQSAMARINPDIDNSEIKQLFIDIKLSLDNEDLGQAFYEKLIAKSGIRLIDFSNFSNNSFHVVTELTYKNGDDEFRPDITLLINGLPLVFIEVKKPNNREGVLAERARINKRCQNKYFRRFINITQLMIFSNNMEYNTSSPLPIEGAFYASTSLHSPKFNFFREEGNLNLEKLLTPENDSLENEILKDNNLIVIKSNPEFLSNKSPQSPTNRICTSLLNKDRLGFLLQYAFTFVRETDGIHKHVMRYPQFFATKAIEQKLDAGIRKGIIWHTQGSGKTALAYYNTHFLTDYFKQRNIIPKFYFIVDRLNLLIQAHKEFTSRGLIVHTVDSREAFSREIKSTQAIHNDSGKTEITVVNIQKFKDDPNVVSINDYNTNMQRIYFLDEVHRSYNPKGSFLANLVLSDINAIKIGLTGTPLLSKDYSSKEIFGDYIHKYYYNASIADGYTLRLIREDIETNYKLALKEALAKLELEMGSINSKDVYAHDNFAKPMLNYILKNFAQSRQALADNTIGAMVICDSSKQAKKLYHLFQEHIKNVDNQPSHNTHSKNTIKSAALILHDIGSNEERKQWIEDFKDGKYDLVFVYNMLLTGFDSPRLKKLYLGRVIRRHNLLQALTRVNRPYKDFRYGYIVDFADIKKEFDATNKAYFDELQAEHGDEIKHYSNLFKTEEEIKQEIENIKDILFQYNTENAEIFSQQISQIQDYEKMLALKKTLGNAKDLYNLLRLQGFHETLKALDFHKLNILYKEVSNHLDLLNLKIRLEDNNNTENLLHLALEDILFTFTKVGEEELIIADKLKDTLRRTRESFINNFDQHDPKYLSLKEELERLFRKKNLNEISHEAMTANIGSLNAIHEKIKELNRTNSLLREKYQGDAKYARVHKRIQENKTLDTPERKLFDVLTSLKEKVDVEIFNNREILNNDGYLHKMMMPHVIEILDNNYKIQLKPQNFQEINKLVVTEYLQEFNAEETVGAF